MTVTCMVNAQTVLAAMIVRVLLAFLEMDYPAVC